MRLFAGIDGGQSSTVVVIGDDARELARASGPPADLVGTTRDSGRQFESIRATVAAALAKAGVDSGVRVAGLVAGVSGFDRGESLEPNFAPVAERSALVHDSEIAHVGAFGGGCGIVVIAGTGSVALGNASAGAPFVRAGGWGYYFGDEGSAVWIARTALRRAMALHDAGLRCELGQQALALYGTFSLRSIQHAFAHGDLTRPALASFASDVLALAVAGDADAIAVRDAACAELAELVATVDMRLGAATGAARPVSYVGGLFGDDAFVAGFGAAVRERLATVRVVPPAHDPAAGALVLARRLHADGVPA